MWAAALSLLQGPNTAGAESCLLRQLLLRQTTIPPIAPELLGKGQKLVSRHGLPRPCESREYTLNGLIVPRTATPRSIVPLGVPVAVPLAPRQCAETGADWTAETRLGSPPSVTPRT
jgi:hypothetical protein